MIMATVVFPITVVIVDCDIAEAEGETRLEFVPEAEILGEVTLGCSVWLPPDTENDMADGPERVVAPLGIVVSEEGTAELGVNVP
jgi:hypothetical protein